MKPLNKKEFVELLHKVLEEKEHRKKSRQLKYIETYNFLYNKYLIYHKRTSSKDKPKQKIFPFFKEKEAKNHLNSVIKALIRAYGKEEVINTLKEIK